MADARPNKLLEDLIEQSKKAMALQFQEDLRKVVCTLIIAHSPLFFVFFFFFFFFFFFYPRNSVIPHSRNSFSFPRD